MHRPANNPPSGRIYVPRSQRGQAHHRLRRSSATCGRIATALAITAFMCGGCTVLQPPVRHLQPAPKAPRTTAPPPAATDANLARLLPISPAHLETAASLAARFAAGYDTYRYDQPPGAWLSGLRPMAASQLYGTLARAAVTPGVQQQRSSQHLTAVAWVTGEQIRNLAVASVIFTVRVQQLITTTSGRTQITGDLAVTVVPQDSGWAVYDVEPAAAGNLGEASG